MAGEIVVVEPARTKTWPWGDAQPELPRVKEQATHKDPLTGRLIKLTGWHAREMHDFHAAENPKTP